MLGNTEMVCTILNNSDPLRILGVRNGANLTPLHIAANKGFNEISKLLIKKMPNKSVRDGDGNTALHLATLNNNTESIELFANSGVSVDAVDDDGNTALHLAVILGNMATIITVLKYSEQALGVRNLENLTPLHIAATMGNIEISKILIDKMSDKSVKDGYGNTALHLAILNNRTRTAELLANSGISLDTLNGDGYAALHLAVVNDFRKSVDVLVAGWLCEFINIQDIRKNTSALHLAIRNKNPKIVRTLIDSGIFINTPDGDGNTSLHLAVLAENAEIVRILVQYADESLINHKDAHGNTALHLATIAVTNSKHEQSRVENLKIIKTLVGRTSILIDELNGELQSALHIACMAHFERRNPPTDVAKLLLDKGASPNLRCKDGQTPLYLAAYTDYKKYPTNWKLVKLLMTPKYKADPTLSPYNYTWTPLHWAAYNGQSKFAEMFLNLGSDPTLEGDDGSESTPYAFAKRFMHQSKAHLEIVNMIKKMGRTPDDDPDNLSQMVRKLSRHSPGPDPRRYFNDASDGLESL